MIPISKQESIKNPVIEKELEFFERDYETLFKKYKDQWISMKDGKILHAGEDKDKVLEETLKEQYELGQFLFKKVLPKEQYVQRFFSRVF